MIGLYVQVVVNVIVWTATLNSIVRLWIKESGAVETKDMFVASVISVIVLSA